MSFDKKDDELIRVVLRPVRGCATDSQYSDAYDRLTTAIIAVQREARTAAFKDCASIATMMAAGETYETGRQKALNIAAALEAAANSAKGKEGNAPEA